MFLIHGMISVSFLELVFGFLSTSSILSLLKVAKHVNSHNYSSEP